MRARSAEPRAAIRLPLRAREPVPYSKVWGDLSQARTLYENSSVSVLLPAAYEA